LISGEKEDGNGLYFDIKPCPVAGFFVCGIRGRLGYE